MILEDPPRARQCLPNPRNPKFPCRAEAQHGQVDYVAEPAALEYRERATMPVEDYEFVERTVQSVIDEQGESATED